MKHILRNALIVFLARGAQNKIVNYWQIIGNINHFIYKRYFQKLIGSDDPGKKLDFDFDDLDDVDDLEATKDVDMEDAEELQEFDPTQVKLRRID